MAGHTNVVEQAVQLADDGRDLLGQVARVHGGLQTREREAPTRMQSIRFPSGVEGLLEIRGCGVRSPDAV